MKKSQQVSPRLGAFLLTIIFSYYVIQVDAQFFTKSSKSIPRMGRRSSGPTTYPADQYRRLLIDTLIDEYGPGLLEALETQARLAGSNTPTASRVSSGEVAYRNDQPLDWKRASEEGARAIGTRDERSTSERDASLAMRALNTNRYIQYLTSGQPLMSYGRLFSNQEGDTAIGPDTTMARERQHKLMISD